MDQRSPLELLSRALSLEHPYGILRDPALLARAERRAAVLVLFAPESPSSRGLGETRILLIRRSDRVATHRRQFALPGGKLDEGDGLHPKDAVLAAALRETEEETGLDRSSVRVLGVLPELLTLTSFFRMTPVVGWSERPWTEHALIPHADEVEKAFWVPWGVFRDPAFEERELLGRKVLAPSYPLAGEGSDGLVWGATAIVLQNLAERLGRC